MPSQILEALERAVPLTQSPLSLGLGEASVKLARPVQKLLELFTDHSLDHRLPEALPSLGASVVLNGQPVAVRAYRLQRRDDAIKIDLIVPSPIDPAGTTLLAISLCNDPLELPRANACRYQSPSACASISLLMYDIVEAFYPSRACQQVGYTKRAMSQFTAMSNVMPLMGREFELYLASDGIHLRQDGDYRGQWLLPPPADRWSDQHPTR